MTIDTNQLRETARRLSSKHWNCLTPAGVETVIAAADLIDTLRAERDAFADAATEAQADRDAALSQRDRQAVEITALETAVSEASTVIADRNAQITRLRGALNINAQSLAWLAFGECRGFDAPVASADVAIAAARAALEP